jgi:DNA-binding transcriptional LysR family regulator
MGLRQLGRFVAVAEQGQYRRHLARCGVTQSAPNDLDPQLFHWATRRVALTDFGKALLTEARRAGSAAETVRTLVRDTKAPVRGKLLAGGIPAFGLLSQPGSFARLIAARDARQFHYGRGSLYYGCGPRRWLSAPGAVSAFERSRPRW